MSLAFIFKREFSSVQDNWVTLFFLAKFYRHCLKENFILEYCFREV